MRYLVTFVLVVILALGLSGCGKEPDPSPPDGTPIDAKALIDGNCARCHGLEVVYTQRDKSRWPAIVADMARRASRNFTSEEVTAMTEYLQENYGR
jgi:mono/diheme cytochrome c family protein